MAGEFDPFFIGAHRQDFDSLFDQIAQVELKGFEFEVRSRDGTVKYGFALQDGNYVEAVLIPEGDRKDLDSSKKHLQFAVSSFAEFIVPDAEQLIQGEGERSVIRLVVVDTKLRRTSGPIIARATDSTGGNFSRSRNA